MDNIQIINVCPKIRLWQQYTNNAVAVAFFSFLRSYFQATYFDFLVNNAVPALSIIKANNDYLEFYATNLLNIIRPSEIVAGSKHDILQRWDTGRLFDESDSTGPISISQYVILLLWIFNWSNNNWTMPSLFKLISAFCGIGYDQISISQDATNLDLIHLSLPTTTLTSFFWSMVTYYAPMLELPFGVYFDIVLV